MDKYDEIILPEQIEHDDDFVVVPTEKYETIIRESERARMIERYLRTESPDMEAIRILAGVN